MKRDLIYLTLIAALMTAAQVTAQTAPEAPAEIRPLRIEAGFSKTVHILFPSPVTLEVLQALLLASAVIPLWRIARRHGLSGVTAGLLCALLLLWPAYAGGTSYDVHENKFLTPLLLWLFDFLDRRCVWGIALFSVLTCMVKEDAPVYVAVIALWVVLRALTRTGAERRWGLLTGGAMLVGAVGYFLGVTAWLAADGDGVMSYRYSNFLYDGSDSLFTVIKAVLLSPVRTLREENRLRTLTVVPHNAAIFRGTVGSNLRMAAPAADDAALWAALEEVNLAAFCRSQQGLDTPLHEGGSNLSGGQRQRLAMARALLHDSPIYLFDEATSNVDAESENDIMAAIRKLAGKKTVILISHRLANVVDSDCIYVMDGGRIAEQGKHEALLAEGGVYSRLYNAQKQLEDLGEVSA